METFNEDVEDVKDTCRRMSRELQGLTGGALYDTPRTFDIVNDLYVDIRQAIINKIIVADIIQQHSNDMEVLSCQIVLDIYKKEDSSEEDSSEEEVLEEKLD